MEINNFIFRNYDIRGIVPDDLDDKKVEAIGRAYGSFLQKRKIRESVVGHDCRLSGTDFSKAFIKGLIETGVDVIDLGMVMTQMVYFAQYLFQMNGGAMITASHNPYNYNGFKLANGYSETTTTSDISEIKQYTIDENYFISKKKGRVKKKNIKKEYINDILKRVRIEKKFKVVVDARNGTTAIFIRDIFKKIGIKVIEKNMKADGSFPNGTPDPTNELIMKELGREVLKNKADLGITFDGDGDRVGLVDEKGRILWNDVLVAIFAKEILERFPGSKIVYNTLCSSLVERVIKENGGQPIMWLPGHTFIKAKISEEKAVFGGELSGHFFFKDNAYGHDDGTYAALRILEYLSEKNTTLSKICSKFPKYISSPEIKIGCGDDKKIAVIKDLSIKFKEAYPEAKITDDIVIPNNDGVRADFEDGMIVFRYSQNGPYITVRFEAKDKVGYNRRKEYVKNILKSYPEMIWTDELCINLKALD